MKELLQEIFETLKHNKLRSVLTGFSIAWGIFMLIILLAAGEGLKHGVESNWGSMNKNTVSIYPGRTSKAYHGLKKGRQIKFQELDLEFMENHLPQLTNFSPKLGEWGAAISYLKKYSTVYIQAVKPSYFNINQLTILQGRKINAIDMREQRKVVLLDQKLVPTLFLDNQAIGKDVILKGFSYKVVGIYKSEMNHGMGMTSAIIPFSTAHASMFVNRTVRNVTWEVTGIHTKAESEAYAEKVRKIMSGRLEFDPTDENALYVNDRITEYKQTQMIFHGISLFVWLIGIGTLIAGIVGVGNIMIITVKERTREFGIRKALGATPNSILKAVLIEALIITTLFGYIGMLLGVGLTELVAYFLNQMPSSDQGGMPNMFVDPSVNISIVIAATLVLIIAGLAAGYFPARKAVKVKPIEAMMAK